jgi:hypothetical protein
MSEFELLRRDDAIECALNDSVSSSTSSNSTEMSDSGEPTLGSLVKVESKEISASKDVSPTKVESREVSKTGSKGISWNFSSAKENDVLEEFKSLRTARFEGLGALRGGVGEG